MQPANVLVSVVKSVTVKENALASAFASAVKPVLVRKSVLASVNVKNKT